MKAASSSADGGRETPSAGDGPGRSSRRRRWVLATGAVVMAGVGVATAAQAIGDSPEEPETPGQGRVSLATVTRQTLEQHTEVDGKLGFEGGYDIVNQAGGVITSLPGVGRVVGSGQVLYRVDGKPVILLRGDRAPAYRSLSQGMRGSDVRQLNAALVALGHDASYGPSAGSSYFSEATEDAVQRLQDEINTSETGTLDLGEVVFLPAGKIRITAQRATYGAAAPAGQSVLKATSTTPRVGIAMDASQAVGVRAGDKVTVSLPNGKDVPGTVKSVGRVATTTEDGSTVPVDVRLSDPKATGGLDAASVKVTITSSRVENVLAVPVTALLAMSGGGYSVELADPADPRGARRLLRVRIGMFDGAAGMVQVSGAGLAAGQRVVVPAT